jgi:hypothetical protein
MDTATTAARARTASGLFDLSDGWLLAVLVTVSAFARFFLAALRFQTPFYLPDEFTYSAIARGIAETGRPVIRGVPAHFPALLEPLLAAPFWLTGNPELALRLTQAEHALAMSLGAIPVYLLCRRLDLGSRISIVAVVVALVSPDFAFGSLVVADPIAYPLVLSAVYAAVVALDSPSRRAQVAVVGFVGLAIFTRVQYVLLIPVFVIAAILVARGSGRRAWSTFGIASSAFGLLAVVALALGASRVLGVYSAVFDLHASFHTLLHQVGIHLLLVPFAAGIVLVPGAVVGLARGLVRPHSTAESAFAAITSLLALGLVAQSVFVAATVSGNFGERYVFFVFPLLTPAFALYARRGGSRTPALVGAALLALLAMRFPLSHYFGRSTDSPTLWAFTKLASSIGVSTAALFVSIAAVLLAAIAAWVAWKPRSRAPVALVVVVVSQAVIAATAAAWTTDTSRLARSALPADVSWVDHALVGDVTLVGPPGNNPGAGIEEALWNTSITQVVRLPRAGRFDPGQVLDARISKDGGIATSSGPVSGPVLIDRSGTWLSLAGARLVRSTVGTNAAPFDLWAPTGGPVRVVADAVGLRGDGWLERSGSITVWPATVARRLSLRVSLPDARAATDTIHFTGLHLRASYAIDPKQTRVVSFIVPAGTKPWTVRWLCDRYGFRNGSKVSFVATPPRLTAAAGPLG